MTSTLPPTLANVPEAVRKGVARDLAEGAAGGGLSLQAIADKWDLGLRQVRNIRITERVEYDAYREQLLAQTMVCQSKVMNALVADLDDPEKLERVALEKKVTMAKALSDMSLNLSNGFTGTPATFNYYDIKAIASLNMDGEFKPVAEPKSRAVRPAVIDVEAAP